MHSFYFNREINVLRWRSRRIPREMFKNSTLISYGIAPVFPSAIPSRENLKEFPEGNIRKKWFQNTTQISCGFPGFLPGFLREYFHLGRSGGILKFLKENLKNFKIPPEFHVNFHADFFTWMESRSSYFSCSEINFSKRSK